MKAPVSDFVPLKKKAVGFGRENFLWLKKKDIKDGGGGKRLEATVTGTTKAVALRSMETGQTLAHCAVVVSDPLLQRSS